MASILIALLGLLHRSRRPQDQSYTPITDAYSRILGLIIFTFALSRFLEHFMWQSHVDIGPWMFVVLALGRNIPKQLFILHTLCSTCPKIGSSVFSLPLPAAQCLSLSLSLFVSLSLHTRPKKI
jgi:hypothetical protein